VKKEQRRTEIVVMKILLFDEVCNRFVVSSYEVNYQFIQL